MEDKTYSHSGSNEEEQSIACNCLNRAWREDQSLEVLSRDGGGKTRFNCRLSVTGSLNEKEKFKLRGSSVPRVLVITQITAAGSHVNKNEISI